MQPDSGLEDIEVVEEMRKQKAVSLSMENRLAEQDERKVARLDRENNRRDARGLDPLESLENVEPDEVPDVLLNQAAEILTDFASMDDVDRSTILSQADAS